MKNYPLNIRNEVQLKAVLGVTPVVFERLAQDFDADIQAKFQTRYEQWMNGTGVKRPSLGSKNKLPDGISRAAFVLYFLKNYPLMESLGERFNMDKSTASKTLKLMLALTQDFLQNWGVLPRRSFKDTEEFEEYMRHNNWDEIFLDATERRHHRPKNESEQRSLYSGKKKRIA